MTTISLKLVVLLAAPAGALSLATPLAIASPPPRLEGTMHWYRSQPSARMLEGRSSAVGTTAVIGFASMRALAPVQARYGIRVIAVFPQLRAAEVSVSRSLLSGAALDRRIRYVSPVGVRRHLMAMPNDPLLSLDPLTQLPYEWQFGAAHVDRALDFSKGSPSILVGTIDSGAGEVPDLAGKIDQRWTVSRKGKVAREKRAFDLVGHGTAVASLIAANVDDGLGMAGFGGASHLIVMHAWALTDVASAAALMKLDSLGVRIVNMSFGGPAAETPIMLDAIHKAASDGMLLVAAAGNSTQAVAHPAADLQPVGGAQSYGLAVGASDVHGNLAFFSNSGANLSLLAPGGYDGDCSGVLAAVVPAATAFAGSCYPTWAGSGGSYYAYLAGTSFAAPEVAGIAALIWAARPQLKNYQVANIIKQSAQRTSGWAPTTGCGVLDAGAALALATSLSGSQWATADASGSPCSATGQN
jgi:subtilisin family serine protease